MTGDPRRFLQPPVAQDGGEPRIALSPGLAEWLVERGLSLAYTSYQSGRLILAGVAPAGHLSFNEQNYARAMGLCWHDGALHIASLFQVWRLANMLRPGEYANQAHDAVFVPRTARTTGYVDAHELAVDGQGQVVFVNSRYSCLAGLDETFSFRPVWTPSFISQIAPEDRCHLNGLAMAQCRPAYVTALAATDEPGGWRECKADGGVLIDVAGDAVVTRGLSMPHSPRLHHGRLLLLESGRGWLVEIDPRTGARTDIAFCPGFLRGMAIRDGFAFIGLSKPRGEAFTGLPLQSELERRGMSPWCGIAIVDLRRGVIVHWIRYETAIDELFDVAVIPGFRNPVSVGPATEEILETVRFRPEA